MKTSVCTFFLYNLVLGFIFYIQTSKTGACGKIPVNWDGRVVKRKMAKRTKTAQGKVAL